MDGNTEHLLKMASRYAEMSQENKNCACKLEKLCIVC
jgi:hypothetical protein